GSGACPEPAQRVDGPIRCGGRPRVRALEHRDDAGVWGWRGRQRAAGAGEGVRPRRSRARREEHARHHLRSGFRVEAVHGGGDSAPRARGKALAGRSVRKFVPEVPDYERAESPKSESPIKIRHMLNHTSGLRDWGSVEAIAGWPRTSRAYTHAHVLEIVSHQKAVNFTPGTKWSYSNTGFNLAAIIVSRVSGMPFAEFTRQRLFGPLGMTHTSWRDDFTRILKNRAMAYSDRSGEFHTDMPFENVHGNGGLLTTVGDLLKWNENFTSPKVGDAAFVALQ